MIPRYPTYRTCQVIVNDKEEWDIGNKEFMSNGLVWYTESSKIDTEIYSDKPRMNISLVLGRYPTVFQEEIYAILICIKENLSKHIHILTVKQPLIQTRLTLS
jgi:hypothetical protein